MAIGGESTGWAIQLESETSIDGKQVNSLRFNRRTTKKLETLENKSVRATGKLSHRRGVETGERSILDVSSIREVKTKQSKSTPTTAFSLTGSEWLLEDLGGSGVIDNVQATLAFFRKPEGVGQRLLQTASWSCGDQRECRQLGPLGSTRKACPEAVMNQETKYLNALQAADRFEWKDPYLLLHSKSL